MSREEPQVGRNEAPWTDDEVAKPTAFHDIPAGDFPFLIEAIDREGRVVWRQEVTAPGALEVPALAATYGPVRCRITTRDGAVTEVEAPG